MHDALVAALHDAVGPGHVLLDAELRAGYEADITGRFAGRSLAVVRPADAAQVAKVLRACDEHSVAVVPQGGNTGLVGGGVPRATGGEVVLSLGRLNHLEEVDRAAGQVVAGAGVTLEELQRHARAAGFDVGIDLAARSAATIGGMVATNAGGGLAMRYGTMRAQVAGLEAVLTDGTVVGRIAGLLKDNAGYDLSALLIGSVGTLAVVTRVNVRLVPAHRHRVAALFGLDSMDDALALTTRLRDAVPSLVAADFFEAGGLARVLAHRGLPAPFAQERAVYVVAECAADRDPTEELAEAVEQLKAVEDVAVADDTSGRAALWAYRELQNEATGAGGVPHKLDVSVRIADLPRFCAAVRATISAVDPAAETTLYGHLADGNVHVNVLGPAPDDPRVDDAVLELVAAFGGSISAEHGVGLAKSRHLHLCRSPGEIAAMRRLKAALDPRGTLNPGRVLPA
jgi:FAD/FMN-containing dehydrogenase